MEDHEASHSDLIIRVLNRVRVVEEKECWLPRGVVQTWATSFALISLLSFRGATCMRVGRQARSQMGAEYMVSVKAAVYSAWDVLACEGV